MKKVLIPMALILIPFSLLIWQRFNLGPRTDAVVLASTSPRYLSGTHLRRGETVETNANEFVAIGLAEATIGLSERTSLELHRLYDDVRIVNLSRGRIIVNNPTEQPIYINTLKTQNTVTLARATFINFDFLQTVHLIPLSGSFQTILKDTNEALLVPTPIAVHEVDPPTYSLITFDVSKNSAQSFYTWFDKQLISP